MLRGCLRRMWRPPHLMQQLGVSGFLPSFPLLQPIPAQLSLPNASFTTAVSFPNLPRSSVSSKEFYDRFYSLSRTSTPTDSSAGNDQKVTPKRNDEENGQTTKTIAITSEPNVVTEEETGKAVSPKVNDATDEIVDLTSTESISDIVCVSDDEIEILRCETSDPTETKFFENDSDIEIDSDAGSEVEIHVVQDSPSPVIDLTDSSQMSNQGDGTVRPKRQRNDSDNTVSVSRKSPKKEQGKIKDWTMNPVALDDPAVLAVGGSSVPAIAPGVLQFLGGKAKGLHTQQPGKGYHQRPSQSTEKKKADKESRKSKDEPKLKRQWTNVSDNDYSGRRYVNFSIASYNVLAQNLIEANGYLYENIQHEYLEWEYRRKNLLKEIKYYMPDVMCLQEVQNNHYVDFYEPNLKALGYQGVYKCRTGDKLDGCATFFRTSKFALESQECIEYRIPGVALMDRDNVGVVVKLRPAKHSRLKTKLIVGNTHLLFNPRRGDIKLAQLQLLLATMESMSYDADTAGNYHSTILCGDMNSEPHCDLYRFLTQHKLKYEGLLVREMAGQQKSGRNVWLDKRLLNKSVGITDACQFADDVIERVTKQAEKAAQQKRELERNDCVVVDSESSSSEESVASSASALSQTMKSKHLQYGTGTLKHKLNFRPVYEHRRRTSSGQRIPEEEWEVSTHHSCTNCAVDYIFYSCHQSDMKHKSDRKLKFCARLDLLSSEELEELGDMPNEFVPSDHLMLMGKFALVIN